jgi:MFS family permease
VRPFGAIIFGRIGDIAGRKYTFLITILVMGSATFAVGLLPTFASIGWMAPVLQSASSGEGGSYMPANAVTPGSHRQEGMSSDEKRVIFASSLGTVFEWYDFYLYATLAPFFAALFFPPGNDTAALLSAFATYAAGFLVRPFGAIIFGRIGDIAGRKYTFLITILVMGSATFAVGTRFARSAAPLSGACARRRIRWRGNLCC